MPPQKETQQDSFKEKLDLILSNIKRLSEHINDLDNRISDLEENFNKRLDDRKKLKISEKISFNEHNFENLDEHLKRTYQILESAKKPMTASEVAEKMGRSRSTTSYHLNKLTTLDFLEKFSGTSKDSSRNIFFRPKQALLQYMKEE